MVVARVPQSIGRQLVKATRDQGASGVDSDVSSKAALIHSYEESLSP